MRSQKVKSPWSAKSKGIGTAAAFAIIATPFTFINTATAAVGGTSSAQAVSVDLDVSADLLGLPLPGSLITLTAGTPLVQAPTEDGTATSNVGLGATVAVAADLGVGAVVANTERGVDFTAANSSVADVGLNLLGTDILTVGAVTSSATCFVDGSVEVESDVAGLNVAGIPVTLDASGAASVTADLPIAGLLGANVTLDINRFEDAVNARAGLEVDLNLAATVPVLNTAVNANLGSLTLAESTCVTPTAVTPTPAPVITSLSPTEAYTSGGTSVTIIGDNFTPDSTVAFGETPAAEVTFDSETSLTVVTPASEVAGSAPVTVTTGDVTSNELPFEFLAPSITSVTPNTGDTSGGELVTVEGVGFGETPTVFLGDVEGIEVLVPAPNTVSAITPAQPVGPVDVTVVLPGLDATLINGYSYTDVANGIDVPVISSVTPNEGPTAGGQTVTIIGENFTPNSNVNFGDLVVRDAQFVSETEINVVTPASSVTGPVPVIATNNAGLLSEPGEYTYLAPEISEVTPNEGTTNGGQVVVIGGDNFTSNVTVLFGETLTEVLEVTPTEITVATPAQGPGVVNVTVNNGITPVTLENGYTYVENAPGAAVVSLINPALGPETGGTTVTILGSNFGPGTWVNFGSSLATDVEIVDSETLRAVTPGGSPGVVDVIVTSPLGNSGALEFTYTEVLNLDGVTPNNGSTDGGTVIIIDGSGFLPGTVVNVGATPATNVTINEDGTLSALTPAGNAGTVDITVGMPDGQVQTLPDAFTYVNPVPVAPVSNSGANAAPQNGSVEAMGQPLAETGTDSTVGVITAISLITLGAGVYAVSRKLRNS